MNFCVKCNGSMVGDGFSTVEHCEYAEEETYIYHEPDAGPIYCNYED